MLQQTETKNCLACDKPLKGRSDKKFCDDYCRNTYNNQLKSISNNNIRNINNTLTKNRRILEGLLPETEETARAKRKNCSASVSISNTLRILILPKQVKPISIVMNMVTCH
ncbi:MAG: hypothetical protein WDO16_10100 [Bacteroidota bacterium]